MWQHGVKSRGSERQTGSLRSRGGTAGGMLAVCVGMKEATEQRHGHRQAEISPLPPTAGSFPTVLAEQPPPTSSTSYPSHPKSASGFESMGAWIPAATISRGDIHERERERKKEREGGAEETSGRGGGGGSVWEWAPLGKLCVCVRQRETDWHLTKSRLAEEAVLLFNSFFPKNNLNHLDRSAEPVLGVGGRERQKQRERGREG